MLNLSWRKRPTPAPSLAGPVDSVDLRHADGDVAACVRAYFAGELQNVTKDGTRSVRFFHPFKEGVEIKIKGAGFRGRAIKFGTWRRTGPKTVLFDYDGRMMEDVASGHDNA